MSTKDYTLPALPHHWHQYSDWWTDYLMRILESDQPGLYPTFQYIWRMTFGFRKKVDGKILHREWASLNISTIAAAIGKDYATAKRKLRWLVDKGLIERRKRTITIGRNAIEATSYDYRIAPKVMKQLYRRRPDDDGPKLSPVWPEPFKEYLEQRMITGELDDTPDR